MLGGEGQSVVEDYTQMRGAVCPRGEEEFTFAKAEFEVMCRCPSSDVCQTFQHALFNVAVGGGWGKRQEQMIQYICLKAISQNEFFLIL